ncbi:MAG: hypothetical protein K940chlam9_01406 [Chlamydiae bacterium]|nr:hypothetical protein [Chlamydiota bacterium]
MDQKKVDAEETSPENWVRWAVTNSQEMQRKNAQIAINREGYIKDLMKTEGISQEEAEKIIDTFY